MSYIEAIIFGIVQGITEFLPVSSTAHIIIAELIFGYDFPGLTFEIFLHIASALAVIVYFRQDIFKIIHGFFTYFSDRSMENRVSFRFGLYILTATLITGGLGVLLKGFVEDVMKTPTFISVALLVTGIFLITLERFHRYGCRAEKDMTVKDAIIVGLGQTLSVLPGISRSGSTLLAALFSGLSRETAVRYSFILAIPVILGSSVLAAGELGQGVWRDLGAGPLLVSFFASFVFSWIGIVWLINLLNKGKLSYFSIYLFALSFIVYRFLGPVVY